MAPPLSTAVEKLRSTLEENGEFSGVIPYAEAKKIAEEHGWTMEQLMLELVPLAEAYAKPAISNFHVGAVAQGSTTQSLYLGANMEFVGGALSFTIHAEQSATINAWQHGEEGLSNLAVGAAPCGYCRQFLYEITTAAKLLVLLKETKPTLLTEFLPDAFGPHDLEVEAALMTAQQAGLSLDEPTSDPVVTAALAAANASYAPYTKGFAGIAVQTESGAIYDGRLAENAAYNPSVSPLEAALSMWNFASMGTDPTQRVSLVEADGAAANQLSATKAVMSSFSEPATLDRHGAHT